MTTFFWIYGLVLGLQWLKRVDLSVLSCGGGSSDASSALRKQDQQRQALIGTGMAQINSIFGGGKYGVNPAQKFDPKGSYFTATGSPFKFDSKDVGYLNWLQQNPGVGHVANPNNPDQPVQGNLHGRVNEGYVVPTAGGGSGGGKGQDYRQGEYEKFLASTGQLFTGTQASEGFGDQFYKDRSNAYQQFALPQFNRQLGDQQKNLAYSLADRGLLSSSAAGDLQGKLLTEADTQRRGIADQGQSMANSLRQQVEGNRSALIGQLEASADPAATTSQALQSAATFSAPSTFQPLGNLFQSFASTYLANQAQQAYAPLMSMYGQQGRSLGTGFLPPSATYVG